MYICGQMQIDATIELHRAKRFVEAERGYRELLAFDPQNAQVNRLLGMLLHECSRSEEGLQLVRRACELSPTAPQFLRDLGGMLGQVGRHREAATTFEQLLRLTPDDPQALNNLGVACERSGRLKQAEHALRRAISLKPGYAIAYNNLGNVLRKFGRLDEAISSYSRAVSLHAKYTDALKNLGRALADRGDLWGAVNCLQRRVQLGSNSAAADSELLYTLHYCPDCTPQTLFQETLNWASRHAAPLYREGVSYPNDPSPDRKLRVGYTSADFRPHPVGRFIRPVLECHDHEHFQVFCYSGVKRPNPFTDQLKKLNCTWRDVATLSNGQLAELIRRDQIDVLVDLSGHLPGHRLLVFAERPAPVQVTYLGYPNTTGLKSIDYRITDALHDPPGQGEQLHTEELVRLDPTCWCYPLDLAIPPATQPPVLLQGLLTFAVLNRPLKFTDLMIRLWSRILAAVPDSKLVVLSGFTVSEDPWLRNRFEVLGIPGEKLHLLPRLNRGQYLRNYSQIDIGLDTFPYCGHTTTLDALWMGVPTVTLAGNTHVSRAGLSVLTSAGLPECVAHTPQEYVQKAIDLGRDIPRLTAMRQTIPQRMRKSPLNDARGLTASLERAYRTMWQRWCVRLSGRI
jgi:predicted O-linked N-acetylglucosamine transferase (SPINDLY family)